MSPRTSAPSSSRPLWFGFAETRPTRRGTRRIHLRWGRLALLALGLAALGWVAGATLLFVLYREQKGYDEISFGDTLLFFAKREEIRQAHGEFNIETAKKALAEGDYRAAYGNLIAGLRRAPGHLEGRTLLIQFFAAQGNHAGARQLFETGIPYAGDDLDFHRLYGQFLAQQRDDRALLELVSDVHERVDRESELARVMALFGMQAAARLGRFVPARQFYRDFGLENNLEGVVTAARILHHRGETAAARAFLEPFASRHQGQGIGPVLRLLVELNLELERPDEAISTALSYALQAPTAVEPRLFLLRAYDKAGRSAQAREQAQAIARQFRHDADALVRVGLYARDAADVALARRLYELALEGDVAVPRAGLIYLETHLKARQFERTLALCAQLERENPAWLARFRPEFAALQAIAFLATENQQLGNLYLNEFLSASRVAPEVLLAVANTLEEVGLPSHALEVLEEAHRRDETNEATLARLIEVQMALGDSRNLTARVDRLLHLRRPPYRIFRAIRQELNSDRFVFADERAAVAAELEAVLAEAEAVPLSFSALPEDAVES